MSKLLSYFDAFDAHNERDTAIAFPEKYGFRLTFADDEKQCFILYKCVPLKFVKFKKLLQPKGRYQITIDFFSTQYKFVMTYKDFTEIVYPHFHETKYHIDSPKVNYPENNILKEPKLPIGGLGHSRKNLINDVNALKKQYSDEEIDKLIPGWREHYR